MTGRRFLLYFAWSRPAECDINLAILENRYPTLFEFRRALWPILDELRYKPNQMVDGFLDHVVLSDFELFRSLIKEKTGNEVAVMQRVLDTGSESQLTQEMLRQYDTIIIVSLDHFRSGQHATDVEVQFISEFLAMPEKCAVICPHHDIGGVCTQPEQEIEYRHHGDGLIPPQQQIGGFARSLMAAVGYPIENRYGLNPARDSQGRPAELLINRDADTSQILQGVATFNLHPHLPHLYVPSSLSETVTVLARQSINLAASEHPFVTEGNRHFNAFLQIKSENIAGQLYICDATLWSSAFGGTESLNHLWANFSGCEHTI